MTVGSRIKECRKKLGLSQIELAEKAGIAVNSLRLYEADKRKPKIEAIKKLASALQVDPSSPTKARKSLKNQGFSGFSLPLLPLF